MNIDDCWQNKDSRDSDGHLVPNATRFPDGISGLSDKVHAMNLSLGIYNTAGSLTCAGYPASLEHESVDAADFASWGGTIYRQSRGLANKVTVDYLKYDNCNIPSNWTDQYVFCDPDYANTTANGTCNTDLDPTLAPDGYDWSTSLTAARFNRMRDALDAQNRTILYSLCEWGTADVFSWGNDTAQSWRMSDDIQPTWGDVTRILNENSFRMNAVDFWGHSDADMLEVGNGNLTADETKSHFALWAAMKSPLLIGTDLEALSDDNVAILKNKYLLAFNQDDMYGKPATPYKWGTNADWTFNATYPAEFWAGGSQSGTLVLMLNAGGDTASREAAWSEVPGLGGSAYQVTDIWSGDDLGCLTDNYEASVGSHGIAAILVGSQCSNATSM